MIVVDTTVLVFAAGGNHPLASPCQELVRRVGDDRLRATTTAEALQEFAHVRARRRGRAETVELTRRYHTLFARLVTAESEDLNAGLDVVLHKEGGGVLRCGAGGGGTTAWGSRPRHGDRASVPRSLMVMMPRLEGDVAWRFVGPTGTLVPRWAGSCPVTPVYWRADANCCI